MKILVIEDDEDTANYVLKGAYSTGPRRRSRGVSSASIKPRPANGLFACAAMPSWPIPSVSPTKSSCYARAPALPPKVSGPKDFPRGSPGCSRRWLPIMPDAPSRVNCTAELRAAVGRDSAADLEQRACAQADVFAGQKRDADRLERTPDRPGDSRHGLPPLRLEIVDRTHADRSGRCELSDRPAK
jgi:hypothetical protein